jgi:zinc-ribbon domain
MPLKIITRGTICKPDRASFVIVGYSFTSAFDEETPMASFCTKCGAAIAPESQFCTACGAPANATASGTSAPVANYSQPYAPVGAAPAATGNGGAVKIILIVVGVFVGLGILAACIFAFTVWRVSRSIHVNTNGDKVTLQTPSGSVSNDLYMTYNSSELGTDVYPGAKGGEGSMKMDLPTGSMITGVFTTSDSKEQVLSFYKSKFGGATSVIDTPETAILTLKRGEKESVMVTITANKSDSDGKTQIAIVHSTTNGKT